MPDLMPMPDDVDLFMGPAQAQSRSGTKPLRIRDAIISDKEHMLEFCHDTFSWGDYIKYVWDHWFDEGGLLVCEDRLPVGMCHGAINGTHLWIEGIRVLPSFRRQGVASRLISTAEQAALRNGAADAFMLVDVSNIPSISMAKAVGYAAYETWHYYLLQPRFAPFSDVTFEGIVGPQHLMYVDSWRWLFFDEHSTRQLARHKRIIRCKDSLAILTASRHFGDTLIVTLLLSGTRHADILAYVQSHALKNNFAKIQVLTRAKLACHKPRHKLSLHLMKRSLACDPDGVVQPA